MKKIFTLLALVCCSLSVLAEDYKCNLAVWVNNIAADPQQMNISATKQGDGKYTLELKNFILYSEGAPMPVGNITVNDIEQVLWRYLIFNIADMYWMNIYILDIVL